LTATRVTILWLKQPICFCSVGLCSSDRTATLSDTCVRNVHDGFTVQVTVPFICDLMDKAINK